MTASGKIDRSATFSHECDMLANSIVMLELVGTSK
jgi:hypothetical protein